jgi:hypothetical protein
MGNVSIGTVGISTHKLNVAGNINATSFSGDGSLITNINFNTITNKPTYSLPLSSNLLNNTITFNESTITTLTNFNNKTETNNLFSNMNFINEKQYPPRFDGIVSGETSTATEIYNCIPSTVFKQTITLSNHGTYTIYSSSTDGSGVSTKNCGHGYTGICPFTNP